MQFVSYNYFLLKRFNDISFLTSASIETAIWNQWRSQDLKLGYSYFYKVEFIGLKYSQLHYTSATLNQNLLPRI